MYNSRALSILAVQTCDMVETMVGKMGEAAMEGSHFKGGVLPIRGSGRRPTKTAAPPAAASDDVMKNYKKKRLKVDDTAHLEPVECDTNIVNNNNNNNDDADDGNDEEEDKKTVVKRQRARPTSGTKIAVPPPAQVDGKCPVFVGHLAWGDWSGHQPFKYGGNNSFPRKVLCRLIVKELRRRANKGQWKMSGVLVVPFLDNEYRTSKQAPCLCHRVTGQKIDRHNAKAEEVGAKTLEKMNKTSWKLLVCPECNNVLNRDRSAASAIAANHERRRLAEQFKCDAPVHAGYARAETRADANSVTASVVVGTG